MLKENILIFIEFMTEREGEEEREGERDFKGVIKLEMIEKKRKS